MRRWFASRASPAGLARQPERAAAALVELNSERSANSADVLRAGKRTGLTGRSRLKGHALQTGLDPAN
ncbi:MAG: hypothetical protein ACHRXM_17695 [Isosphaerales bacterium]